MNCFVRLHIKGDDWSTLGGTRAHLNSPYTFGSVDSENFHFRIGNPHRGRLGKGFQLCHVQDMFLERGVLVHIRSDNDSEFIAKKVRKFLSRLAVKPLFIEPGSPWWNGYIESFNGKMLDELLSREIFYLLKESQVLIEVWRKHYNTVRPYCSLDYRPPSPDTVGGQPSQIHQFSLIL